LFLRIESLNYLVL